MPDFDDLVENDPRIDHVVAMLREGWALDREIALLWIESPFLSSEWVSRVALDDDGAPCGWVAATREYPRGWELAPLVVRHDVRRRGLGRALIRDLDAALDDGDPYTMFVKLRDPAPEPFYRRVGFARAGVLPDVWGPGEDELLLARTVPGA